MKVETGVSPALRVRAKFDGSFHRALKHLTMGKIYNVVQNDSDIRCTFVDDSGYQDTYHKDYVEVVDETPAKPIDSHYTGFTYALTEADKQSGVLKVDPYFVSKLWSLGAKDSTGVLFHCLKNISRYSDKNTKEREIKALHLQIKRLAELEGVVL